MAEPIADLIAAPEPGGNGSPTQLTDERLRRIEATVMMLAAQQAAGPPPEGYQPPRPSVSGPLVPMSLAVQAAQAAGYLPGGQSEKRRRWIDWPVVREFRLVSRMYVDPRYSPTRLAQVGVPVLLGALVLNYLFWQGVFNVIFISAVLERLGVMVVAVILYRILAAEMKRYAAVLEYLDRSGRAGPTN